MSIVLGALLPVGSVIHSMLTEAQFQAQAGSGWVLADGRSAAGSVYNTITGAGTIPNMQGIFLRGKGSTHNPDGNLALGAVTAAKTKQVSSGGGSTGAPVNALDEPIYGRTTGYGVNETAPISMTVNIFFRMN